MPLHNRNNWIALTLLQPSTVELTYAVQTPLDIDSNSTELTVEDNREHDCNYILYSPGIIGANLEQNATYENQEPLRRSVAQGLLRLLQVLKF